MVRDSGYHFSHHPARSHAVAIVQGSVVEGRYVADPASPDAIANAVTPHHDVTVHPQAYFQPTTAEVQSNPDGPTFVKVVRLLTDSRVEATQDGFMAMWLADWALG